VVKDIPSETPVNAIGWAQDQLYQLKAQVATLEQQLEQLRLISVSLGESTDKTERSLQDAVNAASQTPRLQEELNQTIALVVQLQDRNAEMKERIDELARSRGLEEDREVEEYAEVVKRTDHLERQMEVWKDRQTGVDESTRRQTEDVSLLKQQVEKIESRVESAESRATKSLEGSREALKKIAQVESTVEGVTTQQEAMAERQRANAAAMKNVDATLEKNLNELRRLELLAERIELHRAERQRLEDRALKLEEELRELQSWSQDAEQQRGKMITQQATLASRLDDLTEEVENQRATLVDNIRKLTGTQDRTKRRQIQELERELRDMRQFIADLTREDD